MDFKLTEQEKRDIIHHVRGLLQGIALTESKALEVLSNDYWFDWSESCDINLSYNDETNNWDVAAYYVNELGQVETDDFTELNIYMG